MHVCGLTRARLITLADTPLSPEQDRQLEALIERRCNGEPVAYLVGAREFWSLLFRVSPAVLIPRPETELLVEQTLASLSPTADSSIADLGTGSGAIAIAVAHERPRCRVVAVDASGDALEVACDNARRLGVTNIEFRQGDWFAPLANLRFDAIVSNPPYIRIGDPHLVQGDVRFEPHAALVSGHDGLDAVRRIVADARAHLHPNGRLLLEHGYDQAQAIAELMQRAGFDNVAAQRDLAGHARVTTGVNPC